MWIFPRIPTQTKNSKSALEEQDAAGVSGPSMSPTRTSGRTGMSARPPWQARARADTHPARGAGRTRGVGGSTPGDRSARGGAGWGAVQRRGARTLLLRKVCEAECAGARPRCGAFRARTAIATARDIGTSDAARSGLARALLVRPRAHREPGTGM